MLTKCLTGRQINKFIQTISCRLCLCNQKKTMSLGSKSDGSARSKPMDDMYDEKDLPSSLRQPGQSVYKFKQYFHESKYKRKPQIDSHLKNGIWFTKCHIIEPKEVVFTSSKSRKKDSEALVMGKALLWLRDNDFIDKTFSVNKLSNKDLQDFYESTTRPIDIKPINASLRDEMTKFCDSFDEKLSDKLENIGVSSKPNDMNGIECNEDKTNDVSDCSPVVRNVFNNTIYREPNQRLIICRELQLNSFIENRNKREENDNEFRNLRQKLSNLPMNEFKEKILDCIDESRVVVITGDTGCGKTTQLPQMLFEREISRKRGALTNIVVSQPRRLSAIAISQRIATEFGEEVIGNSIGYNIRFDKNLPRHATGAILLCSAGLLLRKLASNPGLKGVSHVIIDEVHERDVITDFLLVLLKRSIDLNPDLRVILMSATMNAKLFSEYFNCPLIQVPGRCFEVKLHYLDDFRCHLGNKSLVQSYSERNPKVDPKMIRQLISYIDRNKPDGAILCFLPGWAEIQEVFKELETLNASNHLLVIPVHSKLPHSSQQKIFTKSPVGVRKVVLSTNIAETSLTIDDVVYVIDSGLGKEMRFDSSLNVSTFGTNWISKANALQRSGRAGRVSEGECYRIYTRQTESALMDEFPTPEILRVSLENVVMTAKFHCPNEPINEFLSAVPEPPSSEAIYRAVELLKDLKILDQTENLTVLGKKVVNFTTDPKLSIALVYSSFFSCVKSMLPLVSQLSTNREPFQVMPNEKELVRKTKDMFSYDILSDHIPYVDLTLEYEDIANTGSSVDMICFLENNHLHRFSMKTISETMKLFASHMEDSQLIPKNCWQRSDSRANMNWHQKQLLICSLVPAFVSNYVRLMRGEIQNQKFKDKLCPIDVNTGSKVKFTSESVFHKNFSTPEDLERLSNTIVVYFRSFYSSDARMLTVCDASEVSPIALILFSNNKNVINGMTDDECIVTLNRNKYLKFKVNREDMRLLSRWTSVLNVLFQWFITSKNSIDSSDEQNDNIYNYLQDFIQLTNELLKGNSL